MPFTYEYPRPAVTVDCIVFGWDGEKLKVVLIQRKLPPFKNAWAFPGGFVAENEGLEAAARRELAEETGLHDIELQQFQSFGDPGRDPRGHTVTVAFWSLIDTNLHTLHAATDAKQALWFAIDALPELVFDHEKIYKIALQHLSNKLTPHAPDEKIHLKDFSESDLQNITLTINTQIKKEF